MLIGLTGNHRRGYHVEELINLIGTTIDCEEGLSIAIVGIGNLGIAVTRFIRKAETKLNIVAAFDVDAGKVGTNVTDVPCYHINEMPEIIKDLSISIAILTVPPREAVDIANVLVDSGIKGILNLTSVHLDIPSDIYLKDSNIITALEEIGFFIKDCKKTKK